MVLLALRLGAEIEECQSHSEQPSTLSCAILYGSANTLVHLFRSMTRRGIHIKDFVYQECVLQDVWAKVLDRACPDILKLLIRYIPATERVWSSIVADSEMTGETKFSSTQEVHVTAVDYMLHKLWMWNHAPTHLPSPRWNIVGLPSVTDFASCILYLLQQGVTYTPITMRYVSYFILKPESVAPLSNSLPQQYAYTVAQMLFGNWLPTKTVQHIADGQTQQTMNRHYMNSKAKVCVICLEDHKRDAAGFWFSRMLQSSRKDQMTTLYCGHSFCMQCIIGWGSSEPEAFRSSRTAELSCPICRKPMAREFVSSSNRRLLASIGDRRRNTLGIGHHHPPGPRGPQWLSRDQVTMECDARGLPVEEIGYDNADQTLREQWKRVRQQRRDGPSIVVDLAASETLSPKHVAAKQGQAFIPIQVNNIPVLAGLSGSSPYTVVTPSAAKVLGLVTKQLTSNQFQVLRCSRVGGRDDTCLDSSDNDDDDDDGLTITKDIITMAIIDELVFTLGNQSNIEVKLRNAVVQVADPTANGAVETSWRPGIVLGLDFLESAAWTQATVEVDIAQSIDECSGNDSTSSLDDRRFLVIVHGGRHIHRVTQKELAQSLLEEFRYYAFNGRAFRTPLFHMQPTSLDEDSPASKLFFSVEHKADPDNNAPSRRRQRFTECEWCCRMFPFIEHEQHGTSGSSLCWPWQRQRQPNEVSHGMMPCKLCCDMTSNVMRYVYYCDKDCQRRAHQVHRLRHAQYRDIWQEQKPFFVISFVLGFVLSFLLPLSGLVPPWQLVVEEAKRFVLVLIQN